MTTIYWQTWEYSGDEDKREVRFKSLPELSIPKLPIPPMPAAWPRPPKPQDASVINSFFTETSEFHKALVELRREINYTFL